MFWPPFLRAAGSRLGCIAARGLAWPSRGAEPIHDPMTLRILRAEGLIRPDGVATDKGRAQAAKIARDERRWDIARRGSSGHQP